MREHEVPTHVQTEDRVLLWFTFPQIVAITAVCALSYGAYRYAPVGPSEVRMALAVVLGLAGIVMIVGQIGGRRLPLVAADLLKFGLGSRRYAGPPAQLVRSEPPAPVEPVRSGPGPLRLMAHRAVKTLRGLRKRRRRRDRANGRKPFRPHGWLGKRPRRKDMSGDNINGQKAASRDGKEKRRKIWRAFLSAAALTILAGALFQAAPHVALADGHGEGWSSDEIEYQPPQPVTGRRLFFEGLTVSGDRAAVTLRAATDLDLRVQAFGGVEGRSLRFWGSAKLDEGERVAYSLPLHGPAPSLTFSWEDTLGQAGAVAVKGEQIPYPLPAIDGELCDLRVVSLGWTPGNISGVIESECVAEIEEPISLQTVAGHAEVTETAVMDAGVTAISGTVTVGGGGTATSVPFVPDGETRFQLPVGAGHAVHGVSVEAELEAVLSIPIPPLTLLTHHPERTEYRTETVSLWRPGTSETVSETVTFTNPDGTTEERTLSATLSIPGATVYRDVTLTIVHPEHVKAETVERSPIPGSRDETLALASSVGSDDPFQRLALPEPEPEPERGEQTPADGGLSGWFDLLGWEWPW